MCRSAFVISVALTHCLFVGRTLLAAEPDATSYMLRYKFQAGENLVWKVEHRARVRTTVSGTTQTADTTSISAKRWKITDVQPDGKLRGSFRLDARP